MTASDTVEAFIAAINDRDVGRIVGLCSDDHRFVDAHGGVVAADGLAAAWIAYFGFMPRYGVEAQAMIADGADVAVFGWAWGALTDGGSGKPWRRPCAWRALVRDGRISLWQVYVDTKAVFDLL